MVLNASVPRTAAPTVPKKPTVFRNPKYDSQPFPDFLTDPNAVLKDDVPSWRYGKAPDYSNTRKVWAATKSRNHKSGSMEEMIENLVKNWEVEASFKRDIGDCRTVDKDCYTFSVNGGPRQSAEHMMKVGTYNAVITPNQFFSPEHSDFNSTHKTFKRMMPTFAWEVLEVYTGPPNAVFKWRHWGQMKNDYIGFNESGQRVVAKAHGGAIDFEGMTIAQLGDDFRIQSLEIWFDPLEMFRQIAPEGKVEKKDVGRLGKYAPIEGESHTAYLDDEHRESESSGKGAVPPFLSSIPEISVTIDPEQPSPTFGGQIVGVDRPESRAESVNTLGSITYEEMSQMGPMDCPFLMKWRAMPEPSSRAASSVGDCNPHLNDGDVNPWGAITRETIYETAES